VRPRAERRPVLAALALALLLIAPSVPTAPAAAAEKQATRAATKKADPRANTRTPARTDGKAASARPARNASAASRPARDSAGAAARPAQRQRELQTEQQRLQARLSQTKRQLAAAEASHSEATDALRDSEAAISTANRRLRELAHQRRQIERQVAALQERSRNTAARQSQEERQLGQWMRAQYALSQQPPWQRWVDGVLPHQPDREAIYLGYAARASAQSVGQLAERRTELAQLEAESRDKQLELAAVADAEEDGRRQLLKQQTARRQTLDRLARQIGTQRQSIATLERDEKRLGSLIDELGKVLAEQQRRDALARERQRRSAMAAADAGAARSARENPGPRPDAGKTVTPADIDPPAGSGLAQLRGKLVLPVQGEVTARFGAARRTEAGVNAPTWKGIFIRAREGAEVHAVAPGRVVFADWLRGFGNLLIVDHGEGFLSVYGNNESLLAAAGERVDAGAVIASVGNTGGQPEPGLYFEMRLQGRPFDPLRWAAAR
jgi:septal ring factor EnvC (AmiA/AmiB activator)